MLKFEKKPNVFDDVNRNVASHLTSVLTRSNPSEISQHRYTKRGNLVQRVTQPFAHRCNSAEERADELI